MAWLDGFYIWQGETWGEKSLDDQEEDVDVHTNEGKESWIYQSMDLPLVFLFDLWRLVEFYLMCKGEWKYTIQMQIF